MVVKIFREQGTLVAYFMLFISCALFPTYCYAFSPTVTRKIPNYIGEKNSASESDVMISYHDCRCKEGFVCDKAGLVTPQISDGSFFLLFRIACDLFIHSFILPKLYHCYYCLPLSCLDRWWHQLL